VVGDVGGAEGSGRSARADLKSDAVDRRVAGVIVRAAENDLATAGGGECSRATDGTGNRQGVGRVGHTDDRIGGEGDRRRDSLSAVGDGKRGRGSAVVKRQAATA